MAAEFLLKRCGSLKTDFIETSAGFQCKIIGIGPYLGVEIQDLI